MKSTEINIPPLFRCPISLELFNDPVTLWTGQTYDRSCIQKWIAAGNSTCPVTMQKLHDLSMVPNHTLRRLIHDWIRSNCQVANDDSVDFAKHECSIATIKRILESNESTLDNKLQVLEKVDAMSKELPLNNTCLIKCNMFGQLLQLVFGLHFRQNFILVEKALCCALKLMPFSDLGCLNILRQDSKYAVFLFLFEEGDMLVKKSLGLLIEAISSCLQTKELCEKLGKSVKLVRLIVHLIQHKSEAGIRALSAMCLMQSNRKVIASQSGVVEAFIVYLLDGELEKRSLAAMAMSTIEKLLSEGRARDAILNHPSGVKAVVKMVFRISDHQGSENAVNSLLMICSDSKSGREKAIVDGVLTQLLLLLQSQCDVRTKTKARMLLKLLMSID